MLERQPRVSTKAHVFVCPVHRYGKVDAGLSSFAEGQVLWTDVVVTASTNMASSMAWHPISFFRFGWGSKKWYQLLGPLDGNKDQNLLFAPALKNNQPHAVAEPGRQAVPAGDPPHRAARGRLPGQRGLRARGLRARPGGPPADGAGASAVAAPSAGGTHGHGKDVWI